MRRRSRRGPRRLATGDGPEVNIGKINPDLLPDPPDDAQAAERERAARLAFWFRRRLGFWEPAPPSILIRGGRHG